MTLQYIEFHACKRNSKNQRLQTGKKEKNCRLRFSITNGKIIMSYFHYLRTSILSKFPMGTNSMSRLQEYDLSVG